LVRARVEGEVILRTPILGHHGIVAVEGAVADDVAPEPVQLLAATAFPDEGVRPHEALAASLERHRTRGQAVPGGVVAREAWIARVAPREVQVARPAVPARAGRAHAAEPIQLEAVWAPVAHRKILRAGEARRRGVARHAGAGGRIDAVVLLARVAFRRVVATRDAVLRLAANASTSNGVQMIASRADGARGATLLGATLAVWHAGGGDCAGGRRLVQFEAGLAGVTLAEVRTASGAILRSACFASAGEGFQSEAWRARITCVKVGGAGQASRGVARGASALIGAEVVTGHTRVAKRSVIRTGQAVSGRAGLALLRNRVEPEACTALIALRRILVAALAATGASLAALPHVRRTIMRKSIIDVYSG